MNNTEKEVLRMRDDYANGDSVKIIATRYGWKVRNVRNAVGGKTFKHLPHPAEVSSGKNSTLREEEIIKDIQTDPREHGYVARVMRTHGITYETFRRLRAIALTEEEIAKTVDR